MKLMMLVVLYRSTVFVYFQTECLIRVDSSAACGLKIRHMDDNIHTPSSYWRRNTGFLLLPIVS